MRDGETTDTGVIPNHDEVVIGAIVSTDLCQSTRITEILGDLKGVMLFRAHDEATRKLIKELGGIEIERTDGFILMFDRPQAAVRFSLRYHRLVKELGDESDVVIEARVGIHLGEIHSRHSSVEEIESGAKPKLFGGMAIPMVVRIMSIAQPRQTLMSRAVFDIARRSLIGEDDSDGKLLWLNHGPYRLKGFDGPVELCEVALVGGPLFGPPQDTDKVRRVSQSASGVDLSWRPAANQEVGETGWQLVSKIGEGSFGEVWKARHPAYKELRAFKFSFRAGRIESLRHEEQFFERFMQKAESFDGLVPIKEINLSSAPYYLMMDYVDSSSLDSILRDRKSTLSMSIEERARLGKRIAEILHRVHAADLYHLDLKPSNILVGGRAETDPERIDVRIVDFGLWTPIRATSSDFSSGVDIMGSPFYLAPEQLKAGSEVTAAADIYSLGVILFQLFTGRLPFESTDLHRLIDQQIAASPPFPVELQPDLPEGLQRLILKCLEKCPADRYPSMQALVEDLDRFLSGGVIATRPTYYDNRLTPALQRHQSEIANWRRDGLIDSLQYAGLSRLYENLSVTGMGARLEGSLLTFRIAGIVLGCWLFVLGVGLWLGFNWDLLGRTIRILLGFFPTLVMNALAALSWRRERLREAFIFVTAGAVALPVTICVLLHDIEILDVHLGGRQWEGLTNAQFLASLAIGGLWTIALTVLSRTVLHSTMVAFFFIAAYATILDFANLAELLEDRPATLALRMLPALCCAILAGAFLTHTQSHRRLALPWFIMATLLLVQITQLLALHAPSQWIIEPLSERYAGSFSILKDLEKSEDPMRGSLEILVGVGYFLIAWCLRRVYLVETLPVYIFLFLLGPVCLFGGLIHLAGTWPDDWAGVGLLGQKLSFPDLLLLPAGILTYCAGYVFRVRSTVFSSLLFVLYSSFALTSQYFENQPTWPAFIWGPGLLIIAWFVVSAESSRLGKPGKTLASRILFSFSTPADQAKRSVE